MAEVVATVLDTLRPGDEAAIICGDEHALRAAGFEILPSPMAGAVRVRKPRPVPIATLRAEADLERQLADARQGLAECEADIAAKLDGDELPPLETLRHRAGGLRLMIENLELALSSAPTEDPCQP